MGKRQYTQLQTRKTHPDKTFQTRTFQCPDGVSRLVTFPEDLWLYVDKLIADDPRFSWGHAASYLSEWVNNQIHTDYSFSDALHAWAIKVIHIHKAERENRSIIWSVRFNHYAQNPLIDTP